MSECTKSNGDRSLKPVIRLVLFFYVRSCFLPCNSTGTDILAGDPGFPDFERG
jgi:hypothetical protein